MFDLLFAKRGLSLDRLRSFVAVADAGGIARAAPHDPVRQSQLSRQVSELEEFFGHALLRRRGRSVELTDLGQKLAATARSTFAGLIDVSLQGDASPMPFSLGGGDSLLHWWVIPRLGRVLRKAPLASLSLIALSTNDVIARLMEGRIDFGLVRGKTVESQLLTRKLGTLEYALFVPRKLRGPRTPTIEALREIPFAVQHGEPDLDERYLRTALRMEGSVLVCETFPQVCRAVQTGSYAGLLPTLARDELRDCDELAISKSTRMRTTVHLAWQRRTENARAHGRDLAEVLSKELARS